MVPQAVVGRCEGVGHRLPLASCASVVKNAVAMVNDWLRVLRLAGRRTKVSYDEHDPRHTASYSGLSEIGLLPLRVHLILFPRI
jgi:hypothetical protein